MEAESLASQLLPRMKSNCVTKPLYSKAASFYSNIYEIKLKTAEAMIYQYSINISPELPADSQALITKIGKCIVPDLKKNIGLIEIKGFMAWGRREMTSVLTCLAEFTKSDKKHSFEILVKPVKRIGLQAFLGQNVDNLPAVSQVLNVNAKKRLKEDGMIQLSPGCYYDKNTINQNKTDGKLNVWRGFSVTVTAYNKRLYLQIDPISRVLREESFLQTIEFQRKNNLSLQEINQKYKGNPILRKYGTPKIYKIQEIQYKMNPKTQFPWSKTGKNISYIKYYQQAYGVKIKNQTQPLIKVRSDLKGNKNKENKPEQIEYIYLIPELLSLTGITDEQRANFRVMKSLGQFTKLTADQRMLESKKILDKLQKDNEIIFSINSEPKKLNGYKLECPRLEVGNKRQSVIKNGNILLKQKVYDPIDIKEWIFCYSVSGKDNYDQQEADHALRCMRDAGKIFGISLSEPIWAEVEGGNNAASWFKVLENENRITRQKKYPATKLVFFLLKPKEERLYPELKRFVSSEFNCVSQVVRRKVISAQNKGRMSSASKIVLQINVKLGHPLWITLNEHKIWSANTVAVAGIATSKGKKGIHLGFVGSLSKNLTSFFSDSKQIKSKQGLCIALFEGIYLQWLQTWFKTNNKKLPNVIVIYREGLNEVQAKQNFETQVLGLKEAIEKAKAKSKLVQYNPVIVYILVNKKPSSRIYQGETKEKNTSYYNPDAGSIIYEDLSHGQKGFHLASVSVREGTCTPVSFRVGYETHPDFPFDAVTELTYNQTYAYYNWTGSVRVPAPLQYANKLAKLCSEVDLVTDQKSELRSQLFFL